MGVVRLGIATAFRFRSIALRVGLPAALVALAVAGAGFLRGQGQPAAAPPPGAAPTAESSSQTAPHPASPPAMQGAWTASSTEADASNDQVKQLFAMATALKAEVAKTNQDVLSINVVRKAAAIEQLAHKVRTGGGLK